MIRIYGFEQPPYSLPTFLTSRIFYLEDLRKRLHSTKLHFSSKKQTSTFKVPIIVGPSTIKNREAIGLVDDMMAFFDFTQGFSCQYGPLHIISKKTKRKKRGNYEHQGILEMEQMTNKLTLPPGSNKQNELINLDTTSTIQTDPK